MNVMSVLWILTAVTMPSVVTASPRDGAPLTPESALVAAAEAVLETSAPGEPYKEPRPTFDQVKAARLSRVVITTAESSGSSVKPGTPEFKPISVPSNTLGPGEPLWLRSDRQAAEARIARAEADIAAQEAARPIDDDCDDFVVYGPHVPRSAVRGWYRGVRPPLLRPEHRRGLVRVGTDRHGEVATDDLFDRAQLRFGATAYPRIRGPIEAQQNAQREYARTAQPPIVRIQNDIDKAQLKSRKGAPKPR
ncbi:MAG: hypothetical protein IT438_04555 [Phycisphaerales bacterium]|nr:hypothetical protein [Phycisphaerales bacterium]